MANSGSTLGSTPNSNSFAVLELGAGPSRGINSSGIPAPLSAANIVDIAICSDNNLELEGIATR